MVGFFVVVYISYFLGRQMPFPYIKYVVISTDEVISLCNVCGIHIQELLFLSGNIMTYSMKMETVMWNPL